MAQHRVVANRQDRGESMSLSAQLRMAEGIDAAAHHDQPSGSHPMIDSARAESDGQQLSPCDHPVLLRGQSLNGT
jgi:hypothetical protein